MSLILIVTQLKNVSGVADYWWRAMINDRLIADGNITGHKRTDGWTTLVRKIADEEDNKPRSEPGKCKVFRPDHNGECLNCDDWMDAHTPEAIEAGERLEKP